MRLLTGASAFASLPPAAIESLAAGLDESYAPAGAVLLREGEPGDRLYLLAEGRVEVSTEGPRGAVPLAVLGPGETFGEIALLDPRGERQATITALTPIRLLSLPRSAVEALIAAHPAIGAALAGTAETALVAKFLKQASPFTTLDAEQIRRLAARVERLAVPTGAAIVRQGEHGDACYLLRTGRAEVVADPAGDTPPSPGGGRRLSTLGPGALFGETALLTDAPRNATVRALEPCEVLVLRRAVLLNALAGDRRVAEQIAELTRLRARPRQTPGIEAHHRLTEDGETITTLKDPVRGVYYRLSPRGWFLWQRLDGRHTLRDLALDYLTEFHSFAPDTIAEMVTALATAGFVQGMAAPRAIDARDTATGWRALIGHLVRALRWRTGLRRVDAPLTRMYDQWVHYLYTRRGQAALALIAAGGLVAFLYSSGRTQDDFRSATRGVPLLVFLLPAYAAAVVIHEAGHAFTTKAFGHEVPRVGIGWYLFGPVAFVDTSDMWLAGRWPRVAVSAAGPYTSAILGGLAGIGAAWLPHGGLSAYCWQFALASYITVLTNLNPLIEGDGYYILQDLLERTNLRRRALGWLGRGMLPALRRDGLAALRGHGFDLAYGTAALAYVAVIAFAVMFVYRIVAEAWIARLLPDTIATWLAAVFALVIVALTAGSVIADMLHREH
jgi:putative peptide zinc metalloprotease protein